MCANMNNIVMKELSFLIIQNDENAKRLTEDWIKQ